jgi:hypothetical protein
VPPCPGFGTCLWPAARNSFVLAAHRLLLRNLWSNSTALLPAFNPDNEGDKWRRLKSEMDMSRHAGMLAVESVLLGAELEGAEVDGVPG